MPSPGIRPFFVQRLHPINGGLVPISFRRQHHVKFTHRLFHVPGAFASARHHETVASHIGLRATITVDHIDLTLEQVDKLVIRRCLDDVLVRLAFPHTGIQLPCLIGVKTAPAFLRIARLKPFPVGCNPSAQGRQCHLCWECVRISDRSSVLLLCCVVSGQCHSSAIDDFLRAMKSLSASSIPGSMAGCS